MTAGKVRVALIEKTGALDVYFEDTIEILMPHEEPLREEAVRAVLDEAKVEFSRIEKGAAR